MMGLLLASVSSTALGSAGDSDYALFNFLQTQIITTNSKPHNYTLNLTPGQYVLGFAGYYSDSLWGKVLVPTITGSAEIEIIGDLNENSSNEQLTFLKIFVTEAGSYTVSFGTEHSAPYWYRTTIILWSANIYVDLNNSQVFKVYGNSPQVVSIEQFEKGATLAMFSRNTDTSFSQDTVILDLPLTDIESGAFWVAAGQKYNNVEGTIDATSTGGGSSNRMLNLYMTFPRTPDNLNLDENKSYVLFGIGAEGTVGVSTSKTSIVLGSFADGVSALKSRTYVIYEGTT